MKVNVSRTFVIGLGAYLAQLAASVVRTMELPAVFHAFYECEPCYGLTEVAQRCRQLAGGLSGRASDPRYPLSPRGLLPKLSDWYLSGTIKFETQDFAHICSIVQELEARMRQATGEPDLATANLRLAASDAAWGLVHRVFPLVLRFELYRVKCAGRSVHITPKSHSVEALCGRRDWLYA